jgi:hypothetical protein
LGGFDGGLVNSARGAPQELGGGIRVDFAFGLVGSRQRRMEEVEQPVANVAADHSGIDRSFEESEDLSGFRRSGGRGGCGWGL